MSNWAIPLNAHVSSPTLIDGELEVMEIEKKIHGQVRKQMEKSQRDYYLNEQMKIIKKELGNDGDPGDEIDELKASIEAAQMPKDILDKSLKELKRLEKMPPLSAESAVVRTYIEWLRDIPWQKASTDIESIEHASEVLNADHYGLDEVKERILEFIAVRHLSKKNQGTDSVFRWASGSRQDVARSFRCACAGS